ncbi:hypothetical protein [Enterobacter hormaechei]|nr:hypothetical protein [Enterobacter hormaechei]
MAENCVASFAASSRAAFRLLPVTASCALALRKPSIRPAWASSSFNLARLC